MDLTNRQLTWGGVVVAAMFAAACGGGELTVASETLQAEDEESATLTGELTTAAPLGSTLQATANVNLRSGPSTGYKVLLVIPNGAKATTVDQTAPNNGFYKVKYNGTVGWTHGAYFKLIASPNGLPASIPVGSTLQATANVNLRSGASTSYQVLKVVSSGAKVVTVGQTTATNGFVKVNFNGTVGWSHGNYFKLVSTGTTAPPPPSSSPRDAAIARAKTGVGFSYWWGHGRWLSTGATSSNKGYCSGSCPNCSHSGSYGADCSGYVAKVWQVPSTNTKLDVDSHPYSTANFVTSTSQWSIISRGSVQKADALVYRADGAGHMFVYESGDGWGSMWAYEARGCSYGIVRNLRTASSAYKAIRRAGW